MPFSTWMNIVIVVASAKSYINHTISIEILFTFTLLPQ